MYYFSLKIIVLHTGRPCKDVYDEANPDWAPTIFHKDVGSTEPSRKDVNRHERRMKREALKDVLSSFDQNLSMQVTSIYTFFSLLNILF